MIDSTGTSKPGYDNIRFYGFAILLDRYVLHRYSKSNSAELQEAINSMFRWYRNAAKSYVYLSDVSRPALASPGIVFSEQQVVHPGVDPSGACCSGVS